MNIEAEIVDAANYSIKENIGSNDTMTAFILACYGEGEPTDNAKKFHNELFSNDFDKVNLSSSSYAVFGLGNSQCFRDRFNVIGKAVDKRLQNLGAKQIIPCGLGDASKNINAEFTEWKNQLLQTLKEYHPIVTENKIESTSTPTTTTTTTTTNNNTIINENITSSPQVSVISNLPPMSLSIRQMAMVPADRPIILAKVQQTEQLFTTTDEFSSAMHLTFDLKTSHPLIPIGCSGLTPEVLTSKLMAGDHVGIFAPNSKHVVERFIVAAGLSISDLDSSYNPFSNDSSSSTSTTSSITLRQLLTWQIQLTNIAPLTSLKVLQRWAQDPNTGIPLTANYLQSLISEYDTVFRSKGYDITSVLEMIPKRRPPHNNPIPLNALLKTLSPLAPRLYSFTHNPVTHRSSASLLCRLLRYRDSRPNSGSKIVDGVCSSFLCEGLSNDDEVALFFRESNFHLPSDPKKPVIMIAGGTGIAPFMSFLEERMRIYQTSSSSENVLGPAVLYFGSRNADEYMFREELLKFIKESNGKVLTKLMVSFSSPNGKELVSKHPNEHILSGTKNIPDVALDDSNYLSSLIDQYGHIYVCGGAGNFGKAVRHTVDELVKLSSFGSKITAQHDQEGVRILVEQKRYFEDLAD